MAIIRRTIFFLLLSVSSYAANITGAWLTTSEKVARQDLWPGTTCSSCVYTTNWNGKNAYMFGGKGEIVHGIVYLQNNSGSTATNVNVKISSFTDNLGHFIIPVTVSSGSVWDSNASGPINLFYYRYLAIRGLFQEDYDITEIDERDLPIKFRVPCSGTAPCTPDSATHLWTNRQDHDKFYPDIAIPWELQKASSFTVMASASQAIGMDVYIDTNTVIPSNQSFNVFYATMSVYEGTVLSTAIPIQLKVYNFQMPTRPRLQVTAAIGPTHISLFHGGNELIWGVGGSSQTTREHYYQYLWRNGIIPLGDGHMLDGTPKHDYPSPEYQKQLDGTLYTPANGFGNSPRISSGVPFYAIGTYASWIDPVNFSSITITGGSGAFCPNISSWSVNMAGYSGVRIVIYLEDEPPTYNLINDVERLANVMTNTCTMPGAFINSWVTNPWVETMASAPHINMPVTAIWAIFDHPQTDWPIAAANYETTGSTQGWAYNSHSPAAPSFLNTAESGPTAELFAMADFKKGVQGHFIWEVTNWNNPNNGPNNINDMFNDAKTFGYQVTYASFAVTGVVAFSSCPYADSQGTQYNVIGTQFMSGGSGWVVMLSTDEENAGFNPASPSGTLTKTPASCTGDATLAYSSWTKTGYEPVRGYNGFNYSTGDGVLLYPGRDVQDPANNYNVDGPIGSFRLKMVRNGINMYDYASMAYSVNSTSVSAIVATLVPTILYELQPVTGHGYYWTGRQWNENSQVVESNRELLAQWVAASTWSAITSSLSVSATTGFSFNYQTTGSQNSQSYSASGLPTGLSMNNATGVISGIPTVYGSYNVTLNATNALGTGPNSTLVITLNPVGLPFKTRVR